MKKKVVIAVLAFGVVIGGCAYYLAQSIAQDNIDKNIGNVTAEQVAEMDELTVESLLVSKDGEYEFETLEEYGEVKAGDVLNCSATLSNGSQIIVKGYVVNGDEEKIEYENDTIKITIKE